MSKPTTDDQVTSSSRPRVRPPRGGYQALLRHRQIRRAAIGTFIGRLPTGCAVLGIMLLIQRRTGSFSHAGIAVAAYSLANSISVLFVGRLVDRLGPRVLLASTVVNMAGFVGVIVASSSGSLWLTSVAAMAAGAGQPPLTSAFRAFCATRLTDSRTRTAVYSVDAIAVEVTFVVGPPLAAVGTAIGQPELVLYGAGLVALAGTTLFVSTAGFRASNILRAEQSGTHLLRQRSLWLLVIISGMTMTAVAFAEISILARAVEADAQDMSGLILALWAVGSIVGGTVYGMRSWPGTRRQQLAVIMTAAALLFLPLAVPGPLLTLAPAAVFAGLALAPAATITAAILGASLTSKSATEAFAWVTAATGLGGSLGYAAAGMVISMSNERVTVFCGAALGVLVIPLILALPRDDPDANPHGGTPPPK